MGPVIWHKTDTGCQKIVVTLPTRWQGESDCVVGPFSSREVADYFANNVVDFGQFENLSMRVFPYADAWYLEVKSYTNSKAKDWHTNLYDSSGGATRASVGASY
jgi:hypothetical protein